MSARIQGLDRLNRKLAALPAVARAEMEKALAKSADEIVALARSLVPVDDGALKASIGWTWGAAPRGAIALASGSAGGLTVTVFAGSDEAFYARWVEFGTVKMAARPFFFVSYRALRKRTKNRIRRSQRAAAKKVAAS